MLAPARHQGTDGRFGSQAHRFRGHSLRSRGRAAHEEWEDCPVHLFLWLFAVMLVVSGLGMLVRGQVLWGIAIILTGFLVGPGGVFLFS
jgi:hypothetical protein